MTTTRGQWTRFLLAGLCIAAAPLGRDAARAQGFGPDPFKPYNSQYEQYTTPMGTPGGMAGRLGRNDNQFQDYLRGLDGADRASTERYGIGAPYWWAKSFDYERKRHEALVGRRALTKRTFEDTLESINQKYLAYFSEEDPRKRAVLIQEFSPSPRRGTRDGALRSDDGTDDRDTATGLDSDRQKGRGVAGGAPALPSSRASRGRSDEGGRLGASPSAGRTSGASDDVRSRSIPPAPAIRGLSGGAAKKKRAPTETLKRSLDEDDDAGSPSSARRRTDRRRSLPLDD